MAEKDAEMLEKVLNNRAVKAIDVADNGDKIRRPSVTFQRPDGGSVEVKDFSGKKLRVSKSIVRGGIQQHIPAGTGWADIAADLKYAIHFEDSDFE
ncbi:MAG: hypothetical protein WCS77_00065 [Elusimicrobiaceae bacterium]|jgi:hypothetical protein